LEVSPSCAFEGAPALREEEQSLGLATDYLFGAIPLGNED
jgi:hypothetical protein